MLHKSTIQLLRIHFSFFLLPVFLFAVSQANEIIWQNAVVSFIILHLLVYPSSNGYNSYMDRDETPIGGLKVPLQPTPQLFITTVVMDIVAIVISFFLHPLFAVGILLYIMASRAYSNRRIRLKKFPIIGFLTVFIFQGAFVFIITYFIVTPGNVLKVPMLPTMISSILIGALYPLTQVYQHIEDEKDGVRTLSMVLGKVGTFIFSAIFFILATGLLYLLFLQQNALEVWYIFMIIMLPVVLFFLYWFRRVLRDAKEANFKNSLTMNILSTICTVLFFVYLILHNH